MFKITPPLFILTVLFIIFPAFLSALFGDIIITNDGMILNGKIIKDVSRDYIDFANYHGTFHIEYRLIKKIIRTENFETDAEIIEKSGKSVNREEIRINYEAGIMKLKEQGIKNKKHKETQSSFDYIVLLSAFYNYNFGKLDSVLKNSFDFSAACDFSVHQSEMLKIPYSKRFRSEIAYFSSKNEANSITGFRASAGPVWQMPFSSTIAHFKFEITSLFGIGRYSVSGIYEKSAGLKWNVCVMTGPLINISSIIIYPQLKFDYIYDGVAPLYRIGFGMGGGVSF